MTKTASHEGPEPGTGVERYSGTISRMNEGKIVKISDLVKEIAPPVEAPAPPAHLPLPALITAEEKAALERLPEVYGQVVPVERRALAPEESAALLEERETVDSILSMAARRKEDIKVTVANHLDVLLEDAGVPEDATQDDKGHYVVKQKAPAGESKVWSREVRAGTTNLDPAALRQLAADPDSPLTHQDYLAMTEPVRVIEENRFMLHLKKNPHLLAEVAKATRSSRSSASIYVRSAKN